MEDARSSTMDEGTDLSARTAKRLLLFLVCLAVGVTWGAHAQMPLVPHSSHDAFLLIPQLKHLLSGGIPDDARFGMFSPTWFSPHSIPTGALGWSGFWERVLGNVQSHTWIDAPHPMALMAVGSHLLGGGLWVPIFVQSFFLALLLLCTYGIGVHVHSRRVGVVAAALTAGTPALLGSARFIEPHLAVVSLSVAVVYALLNTDGLQRWRVCIVASLLLWTLSRSGEGSGEVVIAGLLVVGPLLMTIVQSDRSLSAGRWVLGLVGLLLPFLVLSDLSWMIAAMERVTRAFADPAVQTDVAEKGGALAHPLAWLGAYVVLTVTDYVRPLLVVVVVAGLIALRGVDFRKKWLVYLWFLVPWLALSWMQRKASWYGLGLIPPLLVLAAIGLERWHRPWLTRTVFVVAVAQMCTFTLVPAQYFPAGLSWVREPLPVHAWRLRRVDWLRPMDDESDHRVRADLDELVQWVRDEGRTGPIAMITMGTQHDYAARYHLSMSLPGVEVVNLTDPRVRSVRYRSLHPGDFSAFFFLDGGFQSWPPTVAQEDWLRDNLRCEDDDALDAFLLAVTSRFDAPVSGFYPLKDVNMKPLGPGQVWTGLSVEEGLCAD